MKKILIRGGVVLVIAIIIGSRFIGKETPSENVFTGSVMTGLGDYRIGSVASSETTVYGSVVALNLASLTTSNAGVISSLDCQPGRTVRKGQVVATISPSNDLQRENSLIQQSFLQQQMQLGQDGLASTLGNFDIQAASLQNQRRVANEQLELLEENLANLRSQNNFSTSDLDVRISNTKKSMQNSIRNALNLFDQTFGVTNPSRVVNSDAYLGTFNESGKSTLKTKFPGVETRNEQLVSMSNTEARAFISEVTDFFSLAAQVVIDSMPDDRYLPKAQLDALYRTFTETANGLLAGKTNFDALVSSADTTDKTYDTQLNQLQSQINSAELGIRAIDDQIRSLNNTRNLQSQQVKMQLLGSEQSLAILQNNLRGEVLIAPFNGVVRSVNVQLSNKVQPGALVCQITPTDTASVKVQIFSSSQIELGSDIALYDNDGNLISVGPIMLELPFKDPLTQNYMYEYYDNSFATLKEGTKLKVVFKQSVSNDEVWIPLSYVTPKLEGYFVKKKIATGTQDMSVQLGDVNNGSVRILSGLQQGDLITK